MFMSSTYHTICVYKCKPVNLLFSRKDLCFRSLEVLLSEALPLLVNKPRLLVLTANCCTLGLMIGRLKEGGESGFWFFILLDLGFLGGDVIFFA